MVINLSRTRPPKDNYVYVGRPSPWGNPFSHHPKSAARFRVDTRAEAVAAYKDWLLGVRFSDTMQTERAWILEHVHELKGKVLGCYCAPESCHAFVLLQIANKK